MSAPAVDVLVVGGGLAGCSAAIRLKLAGFEVALYEAKAYPHDKVCGEFLSPETEDFLSDLGVMALLREQGATKLQHARIIAPDGVTWRGTFDRPGFGISRHALDAALAERARAVGVALHERSPVSDVTGSLATGFRVAARTPQGPQQVKARVVVGAHGKRGHLDRTLKRDWYAAKAPFVGLKAHFRGPSPGDCVDLYAFDGGYCGLSAVEGGRVNACLLVRQAVFRREAGRPADVEQFVGWMARQNPALSAWLARAQRISQDWLSISQVSFARKAAVERGVLMAGDSAGLIAPLAGDGMGMALHGGLMAAEWLCRFLRGEVGMDALTAGYAREWEQTFRRRLVLGRVLQAVLLRPRLLSAGLRLLNVEPALGDYFVSHTRDTRLASW